MASFDRWQARIPLFFGLQFKMRAEFAVKIFFLSCVVVAVVYGAVSASRRILWVQAVPAAVALLGLVVAQ